MNKFLYFCIMNTKFPTYDEARKAIRSGQDPLAFLHLGILYNQGIGTRQNHVLANYFFEKAIALGCPGAEDYIVQEYEFGTKNIVRDIEKAIDSENHIAPETLTRFKKIIEKERVKKNYAILSKAHEHLDLVYPNYNMEKAYDDVLNNRNTIDAEIAYALCTADNGSEVNVEMQDSLLEQLFSPITQDKDLFQRINESQETKLLTSETSELLQCIVNYTATYEKICTKHGVEKQEILTLDTLNVFPYVKACDLVQLRHQAFRCLLSVQDVHPLIKNQYIYSLHSDEKLLNICELIEDKDLQLFLISYVELNFDIEALHFSYLSLLKAYRENYLEPLVSHLNSFVRKLTDGEIEHQLPQFTTENLPSINIYFK